MYCIILGMTMTKDEKKREKGGHLIVTLQRRY